MTVNLDRILENPDAEAGPSRISTLYNWSDASTVMWKM